MIDLLRICLKNTKHPAWRVDIRNRAIKNSGCPECWPTPQSKEELTILFELKWIFDSIEPTGYNLKVNNKSWAVDIYIKELKLIIEYDGIYWHGKKENIDLKKTTNITDGGYTVLRIRQQPLAKIQDHDISFGNKYDGKKITDDVLKFIIANYKLEKYVNDKIHTYLESNQRKNIKQFESYLVEKRQNNDV